MPRQRYELRDPELNEMLEALVDRARELYGNRSSEHDSELVRQMVVTSLRLLRDEASSADLKLTNSALKELRHAFRVFGPWSHIRKVAVFGSARTEPSHPDFQAAHLFAERMVERGWMVITGAGDGIMGAAQGGAGRESSFGVNIRLPFEQQANETIRGDHKLINFRYFFTRKVTFVKESHALALFPGGFGTHDEGFEALTLVQTGKGELLPIVFVDAPGGSYWRDWEHYVRSHLHERGLISEDDLSLFTVTDDVDTAVSEILLFYANYHSSRYFRDQLVIRLRTMPDAEQLETLNAEFGDLLTAGAIEAGPHLPGESERSARLPRIAFRQNRKAVGRLRQLIDRLNAMTAESASAPTEASPHEIVEGSMPEAAELLVESEGFPDDSSDSRS